MFKYLQFTTFLNMLTAYILQLKIQTSHHIINVEYDWFPCHLGDELLCLCGETQTTGEWEAATYSRSKHSTNG
jgi:hypothetical protein